MYHCGFLLAAAVVAPHAAVGLGAALLDATGLQERGVLRSAVRTRRSTAAGAAPAPDDRLRGANASRDSAEERAAARERIRFVVDAQLIVVNPSYMEKPCTIVEVKKDTVKIHYDDLALFDGDEWLPKDSVRIVSQPKIPIERQGSGILIASMHNFQFHHMHEVDPLGTARPDALALTFSLLGGMCMGAYPVPIKAPSVLAANVHPLIFQSYKSFWVFVTGLCFLVSNWLRGHETIFNFTWLGVLSAAFWIPAGLCCIASVPRLGMGLSLTLLSGTAATSSFLVFWLTLGERMKVHHAGSLHYYMAPVYLLGVVSLMALLVAVPSLRLGGKAPGDEPKKEAEDASKGQQPSFDTAADKVIGFGTAILAGTCCAVQFGVVNVAKRYVLGPCVNQPEACPSNLVEKFDIFGSWMASFGCGAMSISLLSVLGLWVMQASQGKPLASFRLDVMLIHGNAAGILWSVGNIFQLAALTRGGSAVMMPFNQGCSLLLTGLWGLVYYREVQGLLRSLLWFAVAGCLVCMIVLLSHEKVD